jgi:hypothetical protein
MNRDFSRFLGGIVSKSGTCEAWNQHVMPVSTARQALMLVERESGGSDDPLSSFF